MLFQETLICSAGAAALAFFAAGMARKRTVPAVEKARTLPKEKKQRLQKPFARRFLKAGPLLLLLTFALVCGCAPRQGLKSRGAAEAVTMRANPGYVQWLERQSLLYGARELAGQVTGSERGFTASSTESRVKVLLEAAGIWLDLRPSLLITADYRPVLAELAAAGVLETLVSAGVKGVHMGAMAESGALWLDPRKGRPAADDAVSFANAENVGADKDFELLAARAGALGLQTGCDLLPAATGTGPDFLLAERNVRDYPGLYLMSEAPREMWPLLPAVAAEERGAAIDQAGLEALGRAFEAAGKASPAPPLARERLALAYKGGWAASAETVGVDGARRRWIYRYSQDPSRPALNWDDPSGAAKRIFSASAIQTTGLRRMALAGLRLEPFFGLDLDQANGAQPSLEPGPSATRDISREIRRYGGWSIFTDPMPASMTGVLHQAGVDFVLDSFTFPAAEYALLTEDAAPLRAALRNSLAMGTDHSRLARRGCHYDGIDFTPLAAFAPGRGVEAALKAVLGKNSAWGLELKNGRLETTPATLAALSCRIAPEKAVSPEAGAEILGRHILPLALRAALPGLLLVTGQDISGSLRRPDRDGAAFSLGAAGSMARQGAARAPEAYGPMPAQAGRPDSFLGALAVLAQMREQTGIAAGRLIAVPKTAHGGGVAVLSALPDGAHLLAVANFSSSAIHESIAFSGGIQAAAATELAASGRPEPVRAGRALNVELPPWRCRIFLLK